MIKKYVIWIFLLANYSTYSQIYLPIAVADKTSLNDIEITEIGDFGVIRKERSGVPEHLHTGVDLKRPYNNYIDEPIFPIAEGVIISLRDDGPYAQIIIAHEISGLEFYSVYEHVAGIDCEMNEIVYPDKPIARFMTKSELNSYGWQFDHLHLEIMKQEPLLTKPSEKLPNRLYTTYWLSCFTSQDLNKYYWNPLRFLEENF